MGQADSCNPIGREDELLNTDMQVLTELPVNKQKISLSSGIMSHMSNSNSFFQTTFNVNMLNKNNTFLVQKQTNGEAGINKIL